MLIVIFMRNLRIIIIKQSVKKKIKNYNIKFVLFYVIYILNFK